MNYIHNKTGNKYRFVKTTLIKINGEWVEGIIYRNDKGIDFVRLKEDFNKSFTKSIEDSNECLHEPVYVSDHGKLRIVVCQNCKEHIIK